MENVKGVGVWRNQIKYYILDTVLQAGGVLSFSSDTFKKKSFSSGTKKTNLTATSHMSS